MSSAPGAITSFGFQRGVTFDQRVRRLMILWLSIGLLAGSSVGVVAQGAEPAGEAPTGASHFTGTLHLGGDILDAGEETTVDGGVEARGFTEVGLILETSDPRLNGSLSRALNVDLQFMGDEERVGLKTDSWRIENEDGSWTGEGTGILYAGAEIPREDETHFDAIVLQGEGAYGGLTAYVVATGVEGAVEGIVLVGGPPPAPESPAEADSVAAD